MTKNELKVIDELLVSKGFEYLEGLAVYQKDENIVSLCQENKFSYYLVVYNMNNNNNEMVFNSLENFKKFMKVSV